MHYTCRPFLGSHDSLNWSQYWENEPDNPLLVSQKGHLFGLLSLSVGSAAEDLSNLGRYLIEDISRDYYDSPQADIDSNIKSVIRKVSDNELLDNVSLTLVICITHQHQVHLLSLYGGHVILLRQGKISKILTSQKDNFTQISGPVLPQDRLLMLTDEFLKSVGLDQIKSYLSEEKIPDLEENFLSSIYSLKSQDGVAAALIQIDSDSDDRQDVTPHINIPPEVPRQPTAVPLPEKPANIFTKIFSPKPVYVSPQEISQVSRRHRLNILVSILLLIGLFVSAYFGKTKSDSAKKEALYQSYKAEVQSKLNNAQAIKNLNLESSYDLAKQAKDTSQKMKVLGLHSDEVASLAKEIDALLSQTGSSDVFIPSMFYDISNIYNSPHVQHLSLSGDIIYLLDPQVGRIDSVNVSEKSTKNISINDKIKSTLGITSAENNVYVLSQDSISLVTKTSVESKVTLSDLSPLAVASWNGSLYILDSKMPTIYKLTPNSTGFGKPQIWIKEGQTFPSGPSSIAINGKIWIISQSGQIAPFVRGLKDIYKTPPSTIKYAKYLSTSNDGQILAFVDSDNLVYVYKKNGENSAKYNFGTKKILGQVMDSQSANLYVLCSDQKIYKVSL